jgi:hypothetical protein
MECSGAVYFGSADDVPGGSGGSGGSFYQRTTFLHASFSSFSRSLPQQHHGEQSLVQVEEPSPTLATLHPCRYVSLLFAPSSCWMRIAHGKSPSLLTIPLLGHDLAGNTFWEFKDVVNANRYRRIVKFDPKTHYGDVQVSR